MWKHFWQWFNGETETKEKKQWERPRVVGCTLGYDMRPHLGFSDGTILWGDTDKILYPQYWPEGWKDDPMTWPIDPETGEKLRMC